MNDCAIRGLKERSFMESFEGLTYFSWNYSLWVKFKRRALWLLALHLRLQILGFVAYASRDVTIFPSVIMLSTLQSIPQKYICVLNIPITSTGSYVFWP